MAREVLMHGFIDAAVEGEIVFVVDETGACAEDTLVGDGLFVDAGLDG